MYRSLQDQMNDFLGFGMFLLFMGSMVGVIKNVVTDMLEPERRYVPMTEIKKPVVTVTCPICGKVIEIPEHNSITRSEALSRHMKKEHTSNIGLHPQALMIEDGELIPGRDRHMVDPLPLPESALSVEYLPAVRTEPGETKTDALLKKLKDGVQRIQSSDEFRDYLVAMSRFHDYSWNNQLLIMLQKPDATHVAGFNAWKDLGRWVKKGETGIAIFAPIFSAREVRWVRRTDGATWQIQRVDKEWGIYREGRLVDRARTRREAERQLREWGATEETVGDVEPRFIVVYVYDISQTEGEPLPKFDVPVLTGEVNEKLFANLKSLMKQKAVNVSFESRPLPGPGDKRPVWADRHLGTSRGAASAAAQDPDSRDSPLLLGRCLSHTESGRRDHRRERCLRGGSTLRLRHRYTLFSLCSIVGQGREGAGAEPRFHT